ncbi:hypothetical protein [Sporomusa termitida]|uniref:Uncharacterized protein n=1 Tax=Sporomusa termitida TaxID=2377 RepID=A0A517DPE4_9FIRM|nr:hypothetical protein [Sporomusa termitida]QDR79167.1 hypothetical protein SPTER_04350 [Sporomusa termitida]
MAESKQSETNLNTPQAQTNPDYQQGADIDNAGAVYQESGLDATQDALRSEELKPGNKHATDSLVARMLWGHEEKVNLNVRVSEDGSLDLNDDVR